MQADDAASTTIDTPFDAALAASGPDGNAAVEANVMARAKALCDRFPVYPGL